MAMSVEDYLNVSRIESGNMKYEYSDFNLKDRVEEVTDELRKWLLTELVATIQDRFEREGNCSC